MVVLLQTTLHEEIQEMNKYYICVSHCLFVEADNEEEAHSLAIDQAIDNEDWYTEILEIHLADGTIEVP